jgi:hypothetical protein
MSERPFSQLDRGFLEDLYMAALTTIGEFDERIAQTHSAQQNELERVRAENRRLIREQAEEIERLNCLAEVAPRFWSKADVPSENECWLWRGSNDGRYGEFWMNGRKQKAHRVAWELCHVSPPPDEIQVCHRCDVPACVNPSHLFLGTMSDNIRDAVEKQRVVPPTSRHTGKTHCKRGHEFTPENTHIDVRGGRHCRACKRLHNATRDRSRAALTSDSPEGEE